MEQHELREKEMYDGVNKPITDGHYDQSLAVKCINGTFVGKKSENVITYKGIPFVDKQPVGDLRWKAPVEYTPNDGIYEAYNFAKLSCQDLSITDYQGEDCLYLNVFKAASKQEQSQGCLNSAERESWHGSTVALSWQAEREFLCLTAANSSRRIPMSSS